MKLQKHRVAVMVLILAVETHCGIIDSIYGTVRNTTSGLKQDATNVWSYSKRLVGLDSASSNIDNRPVEERRGFIGGMVHTGREKVHSFRNYFWNTDEYSTDAGLFGNMYNRVKNRLLKVKGSILGDNPTNGQVQPPNEKTKIVSDALNKLFFRNGTRQINGHAFQEAIESLRRKLLEIRNNITVSTTGSPHYGEGLIDIRAVGGTMQESVNDINAGLDNDIYDKVDDSINEIRDKTAKSYQSVTDKVGKGADALRNGVDKAAVQLNDLKENVSDATAKENELLKTSSSNFITNAKNAGDIVKRLSY